MYTGGTVVNLQNLNIGFDSLVALNKNLNKLLYNKSNLKEWMYFYIFFVEVI